MDHINLTRNGRTIALPLENGQKLSIPQERKDTTQGFGAFKMWVRTVAPSLPVQLFLLYLGILSVHTLFAGRFSEFSVILYAVVLTLLPRWSFRKLGMKVSVLLECGVALIIMGTLILGELMHFYDGVWWWDLPLHALSGSVLAYVAYELQRTFFGERHLRHSHRFIVFFAICISLGISGGWEIYEFSVDRIFATRMQPSGEDTMYDLVAGFVGAAAIGTLINRRNNFI